MKAHIGTNDASAVVNQLPDERIRGILDRSNQDESFVAIECAFIAGLSGDSGVVVGFDMEIDQYGDEMRERNADDLTTPPLETLIELSNTDTTRFFIAACVDSEYDDSLTKDRAYEQYDPEGDGSVA